MRINNSAINFSERIKQYFLSYKLLTRSEKLGILIIVQLAVLAPFVPSAGWDFLEVYRPAALTGTYGINTWNPYPTYWLLYPFSFLPPIGGYLLWNIFSAVCIITSLKLWRGPFLDFALSLPGFWLFYLGQLEGVLAFGMVLASLSSTWVVGLRLTLLTIKPQIGLLLSLLYISKRTDSTDKDNGVYDE